MISSLVRCDPAQWRRSQRPAAAVPRGGRSPGLLPPGTWPDPAAGAPVGSL